MYLQCVATVTEWELQRGPDRMRAGARRQFNSSEIHAWMRSSARSSTAAYSGSQPSAGSWQKQTTRPRLWPREDAATHAVLSRLLSSDDTPWTSSGSKRRSCCSQVVLHPLRLLRLLLMKLITELHVSRIDTGENSTSQHESKQQTTSLRPRSHAHLPAQKAAVPSSTAAAIRTDSISEAMQLDDKQFPALAAAAAAQVRL